MAKTKEELKEYNRLKKQAERDRLKSLGLPTSSSKSVLESMKRQKEKGLKEFKVLSVDEETINDFNNFMEKGNFKTKVDTLKALLKIAKENNSY